jgi:N-acetylmuramoyl-L-alanine amidase
MKKHRSLAAFIVICSLFVLPVSAAEEAPRIVFADAPAAAAEAVQTITRKLLIPYGVGPGAGGSDLDAVAEGYFAVESIAITAAAPISGASAAIRTRLKEAGTYVSLDDFLAEAAEDSQLDYGKYTVTATAGGHRMEFPKGVWYCKIDGRVLPMSESCFEEDGCLFVPIRVLAPVFSYDVEWDETTRAVTLTDNGQPFLTGDQFYNQSDCTLLAKLIRAEAGNQSLTGKIAVGNVVLNRVRSKMFPNSIKSVIYDRSSGIQFTTAYNGAIDKSPTEECIVAAKLCLEGYSVTESSLFFFNPRYPSRWIKNNRTYVMTIGDHVFYK